MRQARAQQSTAFRCHIYIKIRGLLGAGAEQSTDYVVKIDINLAAKLADCSENPRTVHEISWLITKQIFNIIQRFILIFCDIQDYR